jgi:hypothetical protein
MSRRVWIAASLLAVSAIGALVIIAFNVTQRGHSIYCSLDGCLSADTIGRFSLPFAFLFLKHCFVLFMLWLGVATILQIRKNILQPRRQPETLSDDYWIR